MSSQKCDFFEEEDNPDSMIAQMAGGHDFALVDDRYIIDPWLMEIELGNVVTPSGLKMSIDKGIFDLKNSTDRDIINNLYGPRTNWQRMIEIEGEADSTLQ